MPEQKSLFIGENVFTQGMVMDLAPEITPPGAWTSALNATIMTSNGNEGMILTEMGNGRIETAFLPEGYVPVGVCEFGDVIYVASYNPFLNLSLLGSFPSPERNIAQEEETSLETSIQEELFISRTDNDVKRVNRLTYKTILTDRILHPGDKFIIYIKGKFDEIFTYQNDEEKIYTVSKVGKNWFIPRFLKFKILSIYEDGRTYDLTNSLLWYKIESGDNSPKFYLKGLDGSVTAKLDVDSHRTAVSSIYSVYSAPGSGLLGILMELETLNTFTVTSSITSSKFPSDFDGFTDMDAYIDKLYTISNLEHDVMVLSANKPISIPQTFFMNMSYQSYYLLYLELTGFMTIHLTFKISKSFKDEITNNDSDDYNVMMLKIDDSFKYLEKLESQPDTNYNIYFIELKGFKDQLINIYMDYDTSLEEDNGSSIESLKTVSGFAQIQLPFKSTTYIINQTSVNIPLYSPSINKNLIAQYNPDEDITLGKLSLDASDDLLLCLNYLAVCNVNGLVLNLLEGDTSDSKPKYENSGKVEINIMLKKKKITKDERLLL